MDNRKGPGFVIYKPCFVTVWGRRFGFEYSRVGVQPPTVPDTPYLDRYIVYLGGLCVRLHKFWRGDDDRAPHDHPWTFWTFPFTSYTEMVEEPASAAIVRNADGTIKSKHIAWRRRVNYVRAWRFHKRPAKYRHIVMGRSDGRRKPFWTFVVTGNVSNAWGFWPGAHTFVPWRDWE